MNSTSSFGPIAASTAAPIQLAMQRLWLTGQILPAGARLVVQHEFRSGEERPLEVIYSFMLPRDAALRRFRITGEGFEVHSELKETAEAVKTYERAIADGSLAALARPYAESATFVRTRKSRFIWNCWPASNCATTDSASASRLLSRRHITRACGLPSWMAKARWNSPRASSATSSCRDSVKTLRRCTKSALR
jgi:hypothetical protein